MGIRGLLLRIAAIVAPFVVVFGTVVVVDPYNYFGWSGAVPDEVKVKSLYHDGRTMPFSNTLWKILRFQKEPLQNVLLGDSRLSHFDLHYLQEVSGTAYVNMGIPGGNYPTISDLFTYTDSLTDLKMVVVQVSFRGMNQGMSDWDIYSEPRLLVDKPMLYLSNRRVLETTVLDLKAIIAPNMVQYDVLPPGHWQQVLDMEKENAAHFHLDTLNYERLQAIADRCRTRGTQLLFVEYPTHPEVQDIYAKAGLQQVRAEYIRRLSLMATTIDLDRPGLFSAEHNDWRDPLHLTEQTQRKVIDRVWGSQ